VIVAHKAPIVPWLRWPDRLSLAPALSVKGGPFSRRQDRSSQPVARARAQGREKEEDKAGMSFITKRIEECDGYYQSCASTCLHRSRLKTRHQISLKNNPTKLLKTQGRCPESNKTIPISDTAGGIGFRVAMGGEGGGGRSLPALTQAGNSGISWSDAAGKKRTAAFAAWRARKMWASPTFSLKAKPTKLLKTLAGCPETDRTIPILGRTDQQTKARWKRGLGCRTAMAPPFFTPAASLLFDS